MTTMRWGEDHNVALEDGRSATIRLARAEDAEQLAELLDGLSVHGRCYRTAPTEAEIASFAAEGVGIVAAERGGRIVGAAWLTPIAEDEAEAGLALDRAYLACGLGATLLEDLATIGRAEGLLFVTACVPLDNPALPAAFRTAGLKVVSSLPEGSNARVVLALEPRPSVVA